MRGEHASAVLADADGALRVEDTLEVRATTALAETPPADGLEVAPARDADDFLGVYGADLAPLVRGRLGSRGMLFLVGRLHGDTVACARVSDVGGTSYVSGVQVRPEHRGRGIGRAVSAAATRLALHRHPVAWLHCEPGLAPLYAALGYQPVTAHAHLGPAGSVGAADLA